MEAIDDQGNRVKLVSAVPLEKAKTRPLDTARLEQQLGRLGGTALELERLENELDESLILPVSELNRLRRQLVDDLMALRQRPRVWHFGVERFETHREDEVTRDGQQGTALVTLVRTMEQCEAVLEQGLRWVYCDFEDPKAYRSAVRRYREVFSSDHSPENPTEGPQAGIFVAPPRIHKSGEAWVLKQVRSCEPDGILVRNYDHLDYFQGSRMRGDFSLNVANSLTARYLKDQFRLESLTASYDLNSEQLESLLRGAPTEWFEVTIHQHMPMFHMEHCVFCAFLSKGKDYRDCGRPCDKHDVELVDRVGQRHALKADVGCRNTLYNGRAQTGADYYSQLAMLGVRLFRIEFVNESREEVRQILQSYEALQRGELSGEALWRRLKLTNQLGVTRGTLRV